MYEGSKSGTQVDLLQAQMRLTFQTIFWQNQTVHHNHQQEP
jgi:hypothetical protein